MQESARLLAHELWREQLVLGVGAVVEHHRRPVLAGVDGLHGAVHLGGLLGLVHVVHAHDGVSVVRQRDELDDVVGVEEVAVDEHGPGLEVGEEWGEEAGEGELGALGGAPFPPVVAGEAEVGLLDGADVEGDGRVLEEGVAANFVGGMLAGVVADEDLEWGWRWRRRRRSHLLAADLDPMSGEMGVFERINRGEETGGDLGACWGSHPRGTHGASAQ